MIDYFEFADWDPATDFTDADKSAINRAITDASRTIDHWCNVADGHFAAATATRYFDAEGSSHDVLADYQAFLTQSGVANSATRLYLDEPLLSVTTLKTDEDGDRTYEITWATTDYHLVPYDGPPYFEVHVDLTNGDYNFPVGQKTIQIVGSWGVKATVPRDIRRATEILARRFKARPNVPLADTGGSSKGQQMSRGDADILAILREGRHIRPAIFR